MNFLESIGWQFGREIVRRGFKQQEESQLRNVRNDNSLFQKNLRNFKIPASELHCYNKWKEQVALFEMEYRVFSNKKREKQAITWLESNIKDMENICYDIIPHHHQKVADECQDIWEKAKERVINSL
jgi:hypothetical protein